MFLKLAIKRILQILKNLLKSLFKVFVGRRFDRRFIRLKLSKNSAIHKFKVIIINYKSTKTLN